MLLFQTQRRLTQNASTFDLKHKCVSTKTQVHLRQNASTFYIKRPCVLFIPKTTMESTIPQAFFLSYENKPNVSDCQSTELYKCRYDRRKDKLLRRLCLNKDLALPRKVQFPSTYKQWGCSLLRQTQLQNQFQPIVPSEGVPQPTTHCLRWLPQRTEE